MRRVGNAAFAWVLFLALWGWLPLPLFAQCTYSAVPSSFTLASGGGTRQVTVTATAGCPWTATTADAFIVGVTPTTGSGNGTVSFTVASNVTTSSRNGTLIIAGQTITVLQAGVLFISTASLPNGSVGATYSQTLTALGGITPYTWSVPPGTLPPGLVLNSSTGVISGTPTTTSLSSFTVNVTDNLGTATSRDLSISVDPAKLSINCPTPGPLIVGTPFQLTCTAAGGATPYTFSIASGNLPPGLSLNAANGTISGTPTTAGQFSVSVGVRDTTVPPQTATSPTIPLSPVTALTINCPAPGLIVVGTAFQLTCPAAGGTPPYTFAIASGNLPPGLTLNTANGTISGTPTSTGQSAVTVRVTDAGPPQQTATSPQISLSPATALTINCPAPGLIVIGTPFQLTCSAAGGTPAYTFAIATGSLPPGLSLNANNGTISGTPTTAGQFSVSIRVTDSGSPPQSATSTTISLSPVVALTINCPAPGPITVGTPFQLACSAAGGTPAYTFAIATGSLPPGLSLNANSGTISGTPTTAGQFNFSVRVTDAGLPPQTATSPVIPLAPGSGLTINCPTPGPITVGANFLLVCTAAGGTPPYTFSLASGTFPPGLNLNTTGAISGTPTAAGQFGVSIRVTDAASPAQSATSPVISLSSVAALSISCPAPGSITVGSAFFLVCTAAGGTSPYTFAIASGTLPPGLTLNTASGAIGGVPTTAGQYNVSVKVTDAGSPQQSVTSSIIPFSPVAALTINCPAPAAITVGTVFQLSCAAIGGTSPYTFAVASGSLPPGLTLNAATGAISGTPTNVGQYSFSVSVTDAGSPPRSATSSTITLSLLSRLTINCPAPNSIAVGSAFQLSCTAAGGTTPYTFSIIGAGLPPGLGLNSATGLISGTPTAAGQYSFSVRVADTGSPAQSATSPSITLAPGTGLTVNCPSPGPVVLGTAFQLTCTAAGGTPPYTFAIATGSLPPGLSLNAATGAISGTPTSTGQFSVSIKVTDSASPAQSVTTASFTLSPASGLTISCPAPGAITLGSPFQLSCTAGGGSAPYTFALATGALPPGLNLNGSNGTISGTPTTAGQFAFSLKVTDSGSAPQSANSAVITLSPGPGLTVNCSAPGPISVGSAFQLACSASGGAPPYIFTVVSGNLPPGLNLNTASGAITGTPTTPGEFTFSVRAADTGSPPNTGASPAIVLSVGSAMPALLSVNPTGGAQGDSVRVTLNGSNFTTGAGVSVAGSGITVAGITVVSTTQIAATLVIASNAAPGSVAVTVTTSGGSTREVTFSVVTRPAVNLTLGNPSAPTDSANVSLSLGSPANEQVQGRLSLSFSPDAAGVPDNFVDPALQFISGGTELDFSIPPGATVASLLQNGAVQQGTVAGQITIRVTRLQIQGVDVLPQPSPSQTIVVRRLPPVITSGSVQLVNITDSGFAVVMTGYSTPRDLSSAIFTFTATSGGQLNGGASVTVPLTAGAATWFSGDQGRQNGSRFKLRVPFPLTGNSAALGGVSVTLVNSSGNSATVSGGR